MSHSVIRKVLTVWLFGVLSLFGFDTENGHVLAEPPPSIERLNAYFKGKGYEMEHLFSDPRFTVHENIDAFFRKSAEKKGVDERKAALRRGDRREAERIFQEEYENYKARLNFEARRDSLPGFMQTYAKELAHCEEKYGIPREVLASVIGIESGFGHQRGAFYAFNVYVSMYLKDYRRSFAVSQLQELLAFCRKNKTDVFALNSSYAGAVGYMQFMPYSLNRWFVGKDVYDMGDAMASTANYLSYYYKRRGSVGKALYAYNPSRYYVTFVLDLAEAGRNDGNASPSSQK